MACQVKRNKEGEITKVLAPNGKESIAYKSLLEAVQTHPNMDNLQLQYKDWVGTYIRNINDPREIALALYKTMYSPSFKAFYGAWDQRERISRIDPADEYSISLIGDVKETDANGEPIPVKDGKILFSRDGNQYQQRTEPINQDIDKPSKASLGSEANYSKTAPLTPLNPPSPHILSKVREFLERLDVKVGTVAEIRVNGVKLGINGLADPLNRIILITKGKEDTALTEEAMHIAVELVQQKNPALFKQLMGKVNQYQAFQQTVQDYQGNPLYQDKEGKPDIVKLKKEAIAKVLADTLVNMNENTRERPNLLAQVKGWWQQIIDWLKSFFLKAQMDPFETAVQQTINSEKLGNYDPSQTEGVFLQTEKQITDRITEVNRNISEVDRKFALNGEPIRNTIDDQVEDFIKKRRRERPTNEITEKARKYKQEIEDKTKQDLRDIFHRRIDDNGERRVDAIPHTNPSAVNPYNNDFYNTLDEHIKDRLSTYETGTKFMPFVNVYNGTNTAGKIDLLAILPDGKMDILQFKVPELGKEATDIARFRQEAYNVEIEGLRKILEKGYGVRRDQFRLTRVLPIKADYEYNTPGVPESGLKLKSMLIGNVKADLIKDDTLLPVPSASETTGNQNFDRLLSRLRGLVDKLSTEKVPPDKRIDKSNRIAALLGSIRRLKVQNNAEGVLQSAAAIVKRQQEKYLRLKETISSLDPKQAKIEELNKVAGDILDEKDQVELYSTLYSVFKNIFDDDSEKSKEYLEKARKISDDAQDALDNFWEMSIDFRTKKMAAAMDIRDEFKPEKQLTWYRRMVRSLSQSSIKAGELLWGLVNRINNHFQLEFNKRLDKLEEMHKEVNKWLEGKDIKDLYNKIFAMTPDGKWKGRLIRRYSKDFYTELSKAQEKGDLKWVYANIDRKAYDAWFLAEHIRRVNDSKTARYHENDAENEKIIYQYLSDFVRTFSLNNATAVSKDNYKLGDFPLEKWESKEYQELKAPGNEPIFKLYNHWQNLLKESFESGMIDEHNGWAWFPNVRKNRQEKLREGKILQALSPISGLRIESEDIAFGKVDPLTGKSVDEVHANYVSDLGKWTKDADDNYFKDYSGKSMDIFRVIGLWEREMVKYNLKVESERMARLIAYTEEGRKALKTKKSGTIERNKITNDPIEVSNEINARYIKDHIDAVWYGKSLSDEADLSIKVPVKAIAEKVNKFFGREIMTVPTEESVSISGIKGLDAMNRFFVTKTLGLNVITAGSNLIGGSINSYINQGLYFDKKDVLEAEAQYMASKFHALRDQKMAGLLVYFHPYLEDKSMEEIRNLSVSKMVRWLSSDHLFYLQRGSDNFVNRVIAMAFIKNTMVKDGKLMNIREYARKELGYENKYKGTYEESKAFEKRLEARVEELQKSPEALLNYAQIQNDHIVLPGIERISDTVVANRQRIIEFIKDALGNTSREDLSLYKRSVIWQSAFLFKNWIPRMVDVRGQSLKYAPGSQKYEWGRLRMLGQAIRHLGLSTVGSLLKQLGGNEKNIVEVAKKLYKEKQQHAAEQEEEFNMNEAEFIDMYIRGVRSEFKEVALAVGLAALLVAARASAPGKDEDPKIKGSYKWMLRALDKFQDEVTFFYNPKSFTDIVNGSLFPAVGMLVDLQRFFTTGMAKLWYTIIGDEQKAGKEKVSRYLFKVLPVTKEFMTYVALFNADIAKDYGIRISSQNGSSR